MALRLGELLLQRQVITQDQLDQALAQQQHDGGRLGHILSQLGFVREMEVAQALGQKYGLPYVDLDRHALEPTVIRLIPPDMARQHQAVPITKVDRTLTVAIADPTAIVSDDLKGLTGLSIKLMIAADGAIQRVIERYYDAAVPVPPVVLLVEADPDAHRLMRALLRADDGSPCTLAWVTTYETALTALRQHAY